MFVDGGGGGGATADTTKLYVVSAISFVESVTVTVPASVSAIVGVPVTIPDDPLVLITRLASSPVAENEYGGFPPVAVTEPLYAVPTVPAGKLGDPIERDGGGGGGGVPPFVVVY